MSDRIHIGTFVWGLVLTAFGGLFVAEALEVWEFTLRDFRYAGPIILVVIGVSLVLTNLRRSQTLGE